VAVTLYICIQVVLGSNLGRDTSYLDLGGFGSFTQSLKANVDTVLSGHDRFLPNPSKFIYHHTIRPLTVFAFW
jgi:hypothetical protein